MKGLPCGTVAKNSSAHAGDTTGSSLVQEDPMQLSPCATTEPACCSYCSPEHPRAHGPQQGEATAVKPHAETRRATPQQQRPSYTQINT